MKKDLDKRKGLRIPQECIDFILERVADMKTNADIAREVAAHFKLNRNTARARVDSVWRALADESKTDKAMIRARLNQALLKIYRDSMHDMDVENLLRMMKEYEIDPKQQWRILAKWDPYKGAQLALKAIDQLTKLHGANAPEQLEVSGKIETVNPLSMTPQERRARIAELLKKGEIEGPVHKEGQGAPALENRQPN